MIFLRYKVSLHFFYIFQQNAIVLTVIDVNFISSKDLLEYHICEITFWDSLLSFLLTLENN